MFIDGAYLSLIAKKFDRKGRYDLGKLAAVFAEDASLHCAHTYFYSAPPYQSPVPTPDENARKARYDRFISRLKGLPGLTAREGRCQKIGNSYRQKGVDTLMTMDLTLMPIDHAQVKQAIIVTADTDFVPVLSHLREHHGLRITLYYYTDRKRGSGFSLSNHLLSICDECRLISPSHFDRASLANVIQ